MIVVSDLKGYSGGIGIEAKMKKTLYRFCWGNNSKRQTLKGRICRVLHRFRRMNSCVIEFTDNGQLECVSRFSVRKINNG